MGRRSIVREKTSFPIDMVYLENQEQIRDITGFAKFEWLTSASRGGISVTYEERVRQRWDSSGPNLIRYALYV